MSSLASLQQRAVRFGGREYLEVGDREVLFGIGWDPREPGDVARKHPGLLAQLRTRWGERDRGMPSVSPDFVLPALDLSGMPW